MAKASVNPEELLQFARTLAHFNRGIEEMLSAMKGHVRRLESSWSDQEQQKFAESFDQISKMLTRFIEESNDHARILTRKARHIEDYLKQR